TSLLLYFTQSKIRTGEYSWHSFLVMNQTVRFTGKRHLVENYNLLIQKLIGEKRQPGKLKLYIPVEKFARKTMGINPGATYGSAKRWNPDKFAKAAAAFARDYDIVIFGGEKERDIAAEVEKNLKKLNVFNYTNLAGKTTVEELCAKIGALSLFITNDSGPMHVAAAYQIPTVAIFGPTKYKETSPWENPGAVIVRREDLPCSPCMKHHCPLKHHHCMEWITAEEVVKQLKNLAG
ncbi:MAG: lipopolysaccharide heptosyltransferase II, partial [Spirochaetia bacterium]|nr:lipopolysaccharide heptosyltransferase II [Spirochaetia bacterium]